LGVLRIRLGAWRALTPLESGSSPAVELSIVMPCLNESETVGICVEKAVRFLRASGIAGEVIVADNGSTDGSIELARKKGARVVNVSIRGYGAALYYGTRVSRGRFVIMGDSDDSYDFGNLMPFVEKLREGYDLVMGNRFKGGILPGAMPFKNRWVGNPVLSFIGRLFFRCPCGDFHCGLRGFSRVAFDKMDLRTTGMEYASEMVIKATLLNLRVTEVPTVLHPAGRSRPPHLRPFRDGWRHLRFMLIYSPRWLFFYPGFLLLILGVVFLVLLLPGPLPFLSVRLGIHTMLYSAMAILVGYQAIIFALFSRLYAIHEGLLPTRTWLTHMMQYLSLETGLLLGSFVLLMGVGLTVKAIWIWTPTFGQLDPTSVMRLVIPATLLITLGLETLFASFFVSLLGLTVRGNVAEVREIDAENPDAKSGGTARLNCSA
jgi:glycosyltransferase involved in cell wall biosynthesis